MGEEIFGDKSPHQVSVSEGSGNAASSRNRSGKFKADTSRRINLDGEEGELVSRQISSDGETQVAGGLGQHDPAALVPSLVRGDSLTVPTATDQASDGPVQLRGGLSDRLQAVSEGTAVENRQALPGGEDDVAQRIRIEAQAAKDNVQAVPESDAAAPNLARLPAQVDAQNRVSLPATDAGDASQGPIIQADASQRGPSVASTGSAPASGPYIEPSNYPHAAQQAKPDPTDQRDGLTSTGPSDNQVPVDSAGLADRHVPLPGEGSLAANRQKADAPALQDHRESVAGEVATANVQHLPPTDSPLAQADIGHAQPQEGPENTENNGEIEALAPTHLDGEAEPVMAEVGQESPPAPQAVTLQADLWREGFRGRVAQIREQVALIHANLDKLEK